MERKTKLQGHKITNGELTMNNYASFWYLHTLFHILPPFIYVPHCIILHFSLQLQDTGSFFHHSKLSHT